MYKFFLYAMLIIIYLGLAKALSPSELGIHYLQNEKGFSKLIKAPIATAILIDTHATGFLIKTYYQKYRVITGYDNIEELIVRTNKDFAHKNLAHIGLSLYRRTDEREELIPVPPGTLYVGNSEFGEWRKQKDGTRIWYFKKSFKNFPSYLGWGDFRPNESFPSEVRLSVAMKQAYFGPNNEFGPEGKITQENFPNFFKVENKKKKDLQTLLIEYLKENF